MRHHQIKKRTGISLMEVLISIGVISLGIFGVATLIPVAQFKVAEGTALDRISAFGPSAAAEFRIRDMGSPNNWVVSPFANIKIAGTSSDQSGIARKGFVIDPLGVIQGRQLFFPSPPAGVQPVNALQQMPWLMPRLNLTDTAPKSNSQQDLLLAERLAQKIFYLGDDLDFDRPEEQEKQPRRQYFVNSAGQPISTVPGAQLSWFATLSPVATPGLVTSDEFVLSIVICKGRTPESNFIGQTEHDAAIQAVNFPGEIVVANDPLVSELKPGDWLLVAKSTMPDSRFNWIYRWTQIIGTSDEESDKLTGTRTISISNDDLIGPGEINPSQNKMGRIFFVTGVESIFERTIRIQNTNAWDEQSF